MGAVDGRHAEAATSSFVKDFPAFAVPSGLSAKDPQAHAARGGSFVA